MLQRIRPKTPGHNVTDATRLDALTACTSTYSLVQEAAAALAVAKKEHGTEIKRWKALGINTQALRAALTDRRREERETVEEMHEYIRFRALQGIPTIQQSLVDLWGPIDLPPERKAEVERGRWSEDGGFAARNNLPREVNPHPAGSEAHQAWDQGWLAEREPIAETQPAAAD